MNKDSKILVLGANGMVGSRIVNELKTQKYNNIIALKRNDLDLTKQEDVINWFSDNTPEYVFFAAAKVGGIQANIASPADFLLVNLQIITNVFDAVYKSKVKKMLFLGSSCIYPKESKQPIKEEYLLTGPLEPTNEGYALAKIAGLKMCKFYNVQYKTNYISAMPCNLYGINDHYGSANAHVISSLITRFHLAKINKMQSVDVWGSGNARRELMFCDDAANALVFLMNEYNGDEFINVGTGNDCSIKELAEAISSIVGYTGAIVFDKSKPDGMKQKLLDVTKIHDLGWRHTTKLEDGIKLAYEDYLKRF